jgi:hypothetical protein
MVVQPQHYGAVVTTNRPDPVNACSSLRGLFSRRQRTFEKDVKAGDKLGGDFGGEKDSCAVSVNEAHGPGDHALTQVDSHRPAHGPLLSQQGPSSNRYLYASFS